MLEWLVKVLVCAEYKGEHVSLRECDADTKADISWKGVLTYCRKYSTPAKYQYLQSIKLYSIVR